MFQCNTSWYCTRVRVLIHIIKTLFLYLFYILETCNFEEDPADASKYFVKQQAQDGSVIMIHQTCAPGTLYDQSKCSCSTHDTNIVILPTGKLLSFHLIRLLNNSPTYVLADTYYIDTDYPFGTPEISCFIWFGSVLPNRRVCNECSCLYDRNKRCWV